MEISLKRAPRLWQEKKTFKKRKFKFLIFFDNRIDTRLSIVNRRQPLLRSILNLLNPDPAIDEIEDPAAVKKLYRYWRIRILYSIFVGYALYYFTRKSFTFAQPGLRELGFDYSELGLLGSLLSISYGVSKFASGILSDRSNPRYFMAIGLMLTGVCNILFGLSSSFIFFALFWTLNGWFQGFGWPPCAKFLTHWYSQSERGSWWSTWNVSHNVGATIIPIIAGVCLAWFGWRWAMYVPGVICILGGFFLINRLRDTPQSLGLPNIEKFRNDYDSLESLDSVDKEISTKELMLEYIIKNKYIWLLACAYFFVYIVRTGINDWTALFLIGTKGYNKFGANGCVCFFEVGGFFGSLFAGWSSDRFFGAKRGPVNALFAIGMFLSLILFWLIPAGHHVLDSAALFMVGFAIFGPQMLIGVAAAELSHKKAAATSTGFIGCFAYMGAAVAGYPFGKIVDVLGWEGLFISMGLCAFAATLFLIPLWGAAKTKRAGSFDSNSEESKQTEPEYA